MGLRHKVTQGEYLSSIARRYGFADWRKIYDHPENERLRGLRPNPNVILPGDELYIPDKDVREETVQTGKAHKFRVKLPPPDKLTLVLRDDSGKPLANEPFTLTLGGTEVKGKTDADGLLEADLPPNTGTAVLVVDAMPSAPLQLRIGHLDPAHEAQRDVAILSGVRSRLRNLGYEVDEEDEALDEKTRAAIAAFQQQALNRKDADGQPDEETCKALLEKHGS